MKRDRSIVRATVTLTVEVTLPDRWGPDCPLDQVRRQAEESALRVVARMDENARLSATTCTANRESPIRQVMRRWRIVGKPKVAAIIVEEP